MKNTDTENMPETSSQPARITRRTFVKRTSATVIVTVLALHAFRNEAMAADESYSGPWTLEYQGGILTATTEFPVGSRAGVNTANPTVVYTVVVVITVSLTPPRTGLPKIGERRLDFSFDLTAQMKATPTITPGLTQILGPKSTSDYKKFLATQNTKKSSFTGSISGGKSDGKLGTAQIPCYVTSEYVEDKRFKITANVTGIEGTPSTPITITIEPVNPSSPPMQ